MKKVRMLVALSALMMAFASLPGVRAQATAEKPKLNVAILLFNGVQIIDYTGPYEVLGGWRKRNVYTVAESPEPLTTNMGMRVVPNYTFENSPKTDILIVPGGNVNPQLENQKVLSWLKENAGQAKYVLSVCNGAFFLAKAGLLDGLEATTTAGLIDKLKELAPKTRVVYDKRFVDNGKIITSAGLSAGIDGALHLIEKLDGKGWAQVVAYGIEYNWQPDSGYARAAMADMKLPSSIYDAFYPGADPLSIEGGVDSWEEKWGVSNAASAADLLRRINEKWAAEAKWTQVSPARAGHGAAATSRWKLTDDKGQLWNAAASVEPAGGSRLTLTLSIARVGASTRAKK